MNHAGPILKVEPPQRRIDIKKGAFNLEKEALWASGIEENGRIAEYGNKLNSLIQQFTREINPTPHSFSKTEALFSWLWKEKAVRHKPHGHYKLNHVIDAQLSKNTQPVGNCLGLTLLYNSLLRRTGIMVEALYLEHAFGRGPHVLTILETRDSIIDVENSLPDGYDYKGHLNDPSRIRWGDQELVADIYLSIGNEVFEKGEWTEALRNYDLAIHWNPHYERAHLNRAILLDKMERNKRTNGNH